MIIPTLNARSRGASTPFDMRVMTFPSLEITVLAVATATSAFLDIDVTVYASMRLAAMASCPLGPAPETGESAPSYLVVKLNAIALPSAATPS
jgi:hypothetical protein